MALHLLAIDPDRLRGLWLRARAGPVRDLTLGALAPLAPKKLHPFTSEEALSGGLDLATTLARGTLSLRTGLLAQGGVLALTMAERCPQALAARLGQGLDDDRRLSLVAMDEAAEDGEGLPPALIDRLALFLDLDGLMWSDRRALALNTARIAAAQAHLADVDCAGALARLVRVAAQLGIDSLRAPLLALAAARAHAAWRGSGAVSEEDLEVSVALTLAHRATVLPEDTAPQDETTEPPPPPEPPEEAPDDTPPESPDTPESMDIPEDILVAAAHAALPPGLLAQLQAAQMARTAPGGTGAGAQRRTLMRGRPLPSRPGRPGSGARVDVIATLRQAAPWQRMRRAQFPARADARLILLPSDLRIRRYQDRSDRLLVFIVDASGSTALARLAEAKGAVELMLAEAYSSRDHVALVSFRGRAADLSLPPTRALVQAKRGLAGLPGGGATPLADALRLALATALRARRQGMSPTLAFLTDGRGNITLDGAADRPRAASEAALLARTIAAARIPSLMVDTSARVRPDLGQLAATMGARLIALPRGDAQGLSTVLSAALEG